MAYQIIAELESEQDYASMYAYIWKRSEEGAANWKEAFLLGMKRLEANPHACGYAPEEAVFNCGLRQLIFHTKQGLNYRVLYIINDEIVRVLRVRGPGQPPLRRDELPLT